MILGAAVPLSAVDVVAASGRAEAIDPALVKVFAPGGVLRASINLGNQVLAHQDNQTGEVGGVSVDIARELARYLGVNIEFVVSDAARKPVDALESGRADIGFFAIDPERGKQLHFSPPYLTIEAAYLVQQDSPILRNEDVDRTGVRVVVGHGSAYDLFLTRELKAAQIVRAPTPTAVVDMFVVQQLDVAAGVKQQLQSDMARFPGLRLLDGRFMAIHQSVGLHKSRDLVARQFLNEFVESLKSSGFVERSLLRHGIKGAIIAAPGYPV